VDRPRLHRDPGSAVPGDLEARYRALLLRRSRREPLQHLTGVQEFWSLRFRVTPAVLIPRPETEGIVEDFLRLRGRPDPLVVDVGTGSGCIAVVVARAAPGAGVHAVDASEEALAVARLNAADHGVADRITFHRGDLLRPIREAGLAGRLDFVLSNPPYVPEAEHARLAPEVRDHEPRAALVAGADGLAVHRRLADDAPACLRPGGRLIVEIGIGQEAPARALYGGRPDLEVLEVRPDLAGVPRILVARRR
jgi:release factor glutamine methyltransferase